MKVADIVAVVNRYCQGCDLFFSAIPDKNQIIRCPVCGKDEGQIIQIDQLTYMCKQCGLKFGAIRSGNDNPSCPACG